MGCVINDILDADFDKKTARCSHRPIASGEIIKKQALALFCVLGLLGATSFLFLPLVCIIICLFSLPLICFYPLAKRYFKFPQLVLGLVFNLGVFVGYFCICRTLKLEIFLLYTIAIVWTIIYDTIYAMQDVDDDILNNLNSSTLLFGLKNGVFNLAKLNNIIIFFIVILFLLLIWIAKIANLTQSYIYFYIAVISLVFVANLCFKNKISYSIGFNLCSVFGIFVFLGLLFG
jgi:4-hydroxybenzoate polyprenyl transferase